MFQPCKRSCWSIELCYVYVSSFTCNFEKRRKTNLYKRFSFRKLFELKLVAHNLAVIDTYEVLKDLRLKRRVVDLIHTGKSILFENVY